MAGNENKSGELTAAQKTALVLASMGAENASAIYKHLSDDDVESISVELARMEYHPIEVVEEVLNEFYELCLTQKVVAEGGLDYARSVLEKAFGADAANALLNRITKQLETKSFERRTTRTCWLLFRTSTRRPSRLSCHTRERIRRPLSCRSFPGKNALR